MLKRGIRGSHIHVIPKHFSKYLGEFEFRWSRSWNLRPMLDQLFYSFTR